MIGQNDIKGLVAIVSGKLKNKTRKQKERIVCNFLQDFAVKGMKLPEYRNDRYFYDYHKLLLSVTDFIEMDFHLLLELKLGFKSNDKVKIINFWAMKKPFNRMSGNRSAQGRVHTEIVCTPNEIVFLETDFGVVKVKRRYAYEAALEIILYNLFMELRFLHVDAISHQIIRSINSFARPLAIVENEKDEKLSDLLRRASGQEMKIADDYFRYIDAGNDYRIQKTYKDIELFEASGRAVTGKNRYTTKELFDCLNKLGYEKVPIHKAVLYTMSKKRVENARDRVVYSDLFTADGLSLIPTIELGYYDGRKAVSAKMCEMEDYWFGRTMWVFQKKVR